MHSASSPAMKRVLLVLIGWLTSTSLAQPAFSLDIVRTFRPDILDAHIRIAWRGGGLTEETRLAVAATGLCWDSTHHGKPVFMNDPRLGHKVYTPAPERASAFAAVRNGNERLAIAFALSLALDPPPGDLAAWKSAFDFLARDPVGFDRVILGILLAPRELKPLSRLEYAAVDLLVHRSSVSTLPALLALAESSDRYLRGRALIGLGMVAFRDEGLRPLPGLLAKPEVSSISAVQRQRIRDVVKQGTSDKNYRTRIGAALALGLMGEEGARADLERLAKDPAYLLRPEPGSERFRVVYPVRVAACAALSRFGVAAEPGGGVFDKKALRGATRGGSNKTNDYGDVRRDIVSRVPLFEDE